MPTRQQSEFEKSLVEALRSNNIAAAISEAIISNVTKKLAEKFTYYDGKIASLEALTMADVRLKNLIYKKKRMLKGTGIVLKEDLTASRLKMVKEASEKYGYKNVWTNNGNIFAKTDNGVEKIYHNKLDVFLEKHWRSVISRSVCDYYLEAQRTNSADISPVIATPHHYLISIQRGGVSFVAVCMEEIPPLFVIEFLHRVVDTFQDYFSDCTESIIKENYVVIYELLDEMLDNGFPLATESNILKELIKPPNILRTIANTMTGKTNVSDILPSGQLSNIPWRRTGVKYTNNEAYFDVIEEVDAIIDKTGATVFAEIQGYIDCCIKLSGMPDLTLSFMNPRLFDDVSFHPCVRFKRWEGERVLSFIPPDGNFRLISYHISSQSVVAIPIYVRHSLSIKTGEQGRLDLTIGPKQTLGRTVEGVKLEVLMPKSVLNCVLTTNQGKYNFDPVSKVLHWDVGKIDVTKLPNIRGNVSIATGSNTAEINPSINVHFTINQLAVSGLKVNRLDMYGEKYKPFKGVKYITKAGRFQIRM